MNYTFSSTNTLSLPYNARTRVGNWHIQGLQKPEKQMQSYDFSIKPPKKIQKYQLFCMIYCIIIR